MLDLDSSIKELKLNPRAERALLVNAACPDTHPRAVLKTVRDLLDYYGEDGENILRLRNVGPITMVEFERRLLASGVLNWDWQEKVQNNLNERLAAYDKPSVPSSEKVFDAMNKLYGPFDADDLYALRSVCEQHTPISGKVKTMFDELGYLASDKIHSACSEGGDL